MLERLRRVHFIGIGGAGMSAVAKVMLERGCDVSGCDLKRSPLATTLEAMGAHISIGHDPSHLDESSGSLDAVIVSSAIPPTNPELRRARDSGLEVITRGEALAGLLEDRHSIVVAGTHGKTTTTSMIVSALRSVGRDPTYLVGGGLNDVGTNAKFGADELAVAESDESDGSFLLLTPYVAVVTNVEDDHLDFWSSLDEIRAGFTRFLQGVQQSGAIVIPAGDDSLEDAARSVGATVIRFGDEGDVTAADVQLDIDGARFTMVAGETRVPVRLRVPGEHNVRNALAAAGACAAIGMTPEAIARGLGAFVGVERRFQLRGQARGVTVIDDYAHHPSEVRATLATARPGPWKRVVAVFQPHRYSRTAALGAELGSSFADADRVVVTDVYAAGEQPVPGVTGKIVVDAVCDRLPGRPVAYIPHRAELLQYLEGATRPGDALLTLGAGDISSVGEELLERLGAAA